MGSLSDGTANDSTWGAMPDRSDLPILENHRPVTMSTCCERESQHWPASAEWISKNFPLQEVSISMTLPTDSQTQVYLMSAGPVIFCL